jgi:CBS domain-containing protein
MKVSEIMTTNVECVEPDTGIRELALTMQTLDVGFLAICENDRLIGTVTDRDMVLRAIGRGRDIDATSARDIMTAEVFWCYENEDVKDVTEKMRDKDVRRMLILNKERRLVGVVSLGDISKVEEDESGKTLRDISEAA